MAGLPPGDPQLVSMIVSHLKTQGLFDQFRRDCLADVDTKPAYLNLKQRVDNFVSNHLSNHTWSPHLNKNQLRNNIRQLVLQSGMLEQGVDRIVAQVVDPKINHLFRPQVERVVRGFLSPGSCGEEPPVPQASADMKPDGGIFEQASTSVPAATAASDAMSILDTITSLNQEASSRASGEKVCKGHASEGAAEEGEQSMELDGEGDQGVRPAEEGEDAKLLEPELPGSEVKAEEPQEPADSAQEATAERTEGVQVKTEEDDPRSQERPDEGREKTGSKTLGKPTEEKEEDSLKSPNQIKQKARERLKEEYSLEDSDLDGLSDITVSSVHTSDLSSFEGESDDEQPPSDSSDDGELLSDGEKAEKKQASVDTGEDNKESKPRRKAYVHKPFLYSRYYSDSDDEVTVEERRRSAAKDKEERLLKRQQNRERMEEKRRQKATLAELQDLKKQRADSPGTDGPRAKQERKERKVLEKKMALNRKRKLDSRKEGDVSSKRKGDTGGESSKKGEVKPAPSKTPQPKAVRKMSECASSDERHRKPSVGVSEDVSDIKKLTDKNRTHSFILELEQGSQEALKQRSVGKFDRLSRKDAHKERKERERSMLDDRAKVKQKLEKRADSQAEEPQQKEGLSAKVSSDEKGEKKAKNKADRRMSSATSREGKASASEGMAEDGGPKETPSKKAKVLSTEAAKVEKDKEKEKDKKNEKDKDKVKDKEKEKARVEKTSSKSDSKLLQRADSTGLSEDRSDMELGSDTGRKKDKYPKEVLKRSKSHSEDRQGDKAKSDNKDSEKAKAEQDGQKSSKSSSESDKDLKRSKSTEKGRVAERPRSKSREEAKSASSSKTDKKAQSLDVKSKGGIPVSKHDVTKEKKKEGNAKEHKKLSEEPAQEKSDGKSGKRKLEKDKIPDKKEESREEKKADRSEKSSKSSAALPCLQQEEPPKKRALLQATGGDSDAAVVTGTASCADGTHEALGDSAPEPVDGGPEVGPEEPRPLPAEADALLALMDICTSVEARLPEDGGRDAANPEATLQDADMKMKEAALTLLSMDPDSTLSACLITPEAKEEPEVSAPLQQPMEASTVKEVEQRIAESAPTETDMELATAEEPSAESQSVEETVNEQSDSTAASENLETDPEVLKEPTSASLVLQDENTTSNEPRAPLIEEKATDTGVAPETQSVDTEVAGGDACKTKEAKEIASTEVVGSETLPTEQMAETSSIQDEIKSGVAATETINEVETMETGQDKADFDSIEVENKTPEEVNTTGERSHPQDMEHNDAGIGEEVETSHGGVKQTRSGEETAEKDKLAELPAEHQTGQEKAAEAKTPRRGRSSRTSSEVDEEQSREQEKLEETPARHGGRSEAPAKEATAANQKKEGTEDEEKEEKREGDNCESGPRKGVRQRSQARLSPPRPEDVEAAGSLKAKEAPDSRKPPMKRKRSENTEESVEETPVAQGEQTEEATEQDKEEGQSGEDTETPTEEQEEAKEDTPSHVAEEGPDQEMALKKPARRGRPPKAAAPVEDPADKKDKAPAEEKEGEQFDEEENDEEGEGTKTRTTTRSASRLEAERNKPSKPSTRASRQSVKDEAGARGTRGQAATAAGKGGRPRGGQKSEEPPSKKAKR